jgi:hypothetical protein
MILWIGVGEVLLGTNSIYLEDCFPQVEAEKKGVVCD